ncbi:PREDICTED: zinc-binding protein A33-like [Gavialis gangeticus]|uniref:zinc-binding protein A33-like n=1 Tax=Gavialis gangeticus TaxID=94835 RepID=UPI00092EE56E|nr:PREDICTED: zinc-binding protein A33-like [Gavialis gangeticus]
MAGRGTEQSLLEELTCAICCDLFMEPVMLECMHHFCKGCIQAHWHSSEHPPSCPQCRREIPGCTFRTPYLVAGVVEKVRRYGLQEHRRQIQKQLEEGLQAHQREMERRVRTKHAVEEDICSLTKVSGELHAKIQAEFERLHQILVEEERTVLMELAKEEEDLLVRLQGDFWQLENGIVELGRNMECIQQALRELDDSALVEVESLEIRPLVQVEAPPPFDADHLRDQHSGPLQYIFWRRMLPSISPAPAPLTFDPETAHPNLVLSENLRAVTEQRTPQPVPSSPKRFQKCVNVLGSEVFTAGSHYWEVWVGNKTKWDLGVAAELADRAAKVKLCPENGYWSLRLRNSTEYWAAAVPWVRLYPPRRLRKVGVLLDCQAGTVAFYNAEDMAHLYTFRQVAAPGLCPFFSTCFSDGGQNAEPMRICHLAL